jgi:uncharacterized protein
VSVSYFRKQCLLLLLMILGLVLPFGFSQTVKAQEFDSTHYIYDQAQLLTEEEAAELQALAVEMGGQRETAFIILTLNGTDGKDIVQYVEDFYDENAPGYDQPHGNTAILAIDMGERDIYLAGFKKAEQYLNDERLDIIREQITPDLSAGHYFQAFSQFLNSSYEYMGQEPTSGSDGYTDYGTGGGYVGQNSYETGTGGENIFFQWWFQLIASLVVAGIVVSIMAYRSGGRVSVNGQTYMDHDKSRVIGQYDNFTHQTVTRQRKPSNNTRSGGGGGITGGGHSHSGSRGKF